MIGEGVGIKKLLKQTPKIELHVHLEGSLSDRFWSAHDQSVLKRIQLFKSKDVKNLKLFLETFEHIHISLEKSDDYYHAMSDLIEQFLSENIRYAEVTWAPGGIHEFHGIEPWDVYSSIARAIDEYKDHIEVKLLVDLIRNQGPMMAESITDWLIGSKPKYVVGVNFGGDDSQYSIKPFVNLFNALKENGYKLTIHAGESEGESQCLESVKLVAPNRVGHATSLSSKRIIDEFVYGNVSVEACPSSNEILGYLSDRSKHPIFLNPILRGSINTDDRSFFSKTLTDEMFALIQQGITIDEIAAFQRQAVEDAFSVKNTHFKVEIYEFWRNKYLNFFEIDVKNSV